MCLRCFELFELTTAQLIRDASDVGQRLSTVLITSAILEGLTLRGGQTHVALDHAGQRFAGDIS